MNKLILHGSLLCTATMYAGETPPNILWILADDMRTSTLEIFEEEQCDTPHLARLAGESTVFSNAHIMGGTSVAVSMPSRAMLMTSQYLYNLEEAGNIIPAQHVTVGEALRDAGYETFHIGKWHADKASFNRCFSGGRDIFFGGMQDHWNVPLYNYDPTAQYNPSRRKLDKYALSTETTILPGEYMYSGKHSVDIFTETAVNYVLDAAEKQQPFFLSLNYMSPHDPRSTTEEFHKMYNAPDMVLPPNFLPEHPFDNGELRVRDERLAGFPRQEDEIKGHIAEYYAMITHLDHRIGEVLSALQQTGQYDNTIIVFMADNGLAVGQHGLMGKQSLYRHSANVPLIIKPVGGRQAGYEVMTDELCYLLDVYPTMCEMAGVPLPGSAVGKSLVPLLNGDQDLRNSLYLGYLDIQRGVATSDWKLIEYHVNGVRTTQLFNLKEDPYEMNDLSRDKKHTKVLRELRSEMVRQRDLTGDEGSFWDNFVF